MTDDATAAAWQFLRAFADEHRLRIAGWLAESDLSLPEIARRLRVKPSIAQRHLDFLTQSGFVATLEATHPPRYRFNRRALHDLARTALARAPNTTGDSLDTDAFGRQVVNDFTRPDGSLKAIPAQEKKLLVILEYLATQFAPDRQFPEREVNEILRRFHDDVATLRRLLVDYRWLDRARGVYWRRAGAPTPR